MPVVASNVSKVYPFKDTAHASNVVRTVSTSGKHEWETGAVQSITQDVWEEVTTKQLVLQVKYMYFKAETYSYITKDEFCLLCQKGHKCLYEFHFK